MWEGGHCVALLSTVLTQEDVDLESSTDAKKLNKYQLRNSQLEHRQPMEQKRGLFCMCDSGVARCQSHNSITSGKRVRCLKGIAWASVLDSCQSNLV